MPCGLFAFEGFGVLTGSVLEAACDGRTAGAGAVELAVLSAFLSVLLCLFLVAWDIPLICGSFSTFLILSFHATFLRNCRCGFGA